MEAITYNAFDLAANAQTLGPCTCARRKCTQCKRSRKPFRGRGLKISRGSGRLPLVVRECTHRGAPTGEQVECRSCSARKIEVYTCSIFGECTTEKPAFPRKVPNARGGVDYVPIHWCRYCSQCTPPSPS